MQGHRGETPTIIFRYSTHITPHHCTVNRYKTHYRPVSMALYTGDI